VAEGVDFEGHYGRAVVLLGVPYQYTKSKTLLARLEYIRENFRVRESDFLSFDALRQASQCLGRVIRSKNDYGLMVLADDRYNKADKRAKLPQWIQQALPASQRNLAIDTAIGVGKNFFRAMAQPLEPADASAEEDGGDAAGSAVRRWDAVLPGAGRPTERRSDRSGGGAFDAWQCSAKRPRSAD
jgi:DNA excision repair protein ERCC-2